MADAASGSDSDSDGGQAAPALPRPPPKRRRIIDPSAITAVPIYSNKVNSSLQLKPANFRQIDCTAAEEEHPWPSSPPKSKKQTSFIDLSDSEEESVQERPKEAIRSPSPPPPSCSPSVRKTRRANRKICEINKKLDAIGSLICPSPERQNAVPEYCHSPSPVDENEDDDIIVISSNTTSKRQANLVVTEKSREIPLKFRCRTDLYKIPILSTAPLSKAVDQLSVKLKVPPSRILLLRKDTELPVDSSANELGLGIADIIDCVVIAEDTEAENAPGDVITVRLQGKEKGSAQEYTVRKGAPLGPVLTQYLSHLTDRGRQKACFLYDGSKVTPTQTPSELDMEDGDVIEVWV